MFRDVDVLTKTHRQTHARAHTHTRARTYRYAHTNKHARTLIHIHIAKLVHFKCSSIDIGAQHVNGIICACALDIVYLIICSKTLEDTTLLPTKQNIKKL